MPPCPPPLGIGLGTPGGRVVSAPPVVVSRISAIGSSTTNYNQSWDSTQNKATGAGYLNVAQRLLGYSLGYVRDSRTNRTALFHFGRSAVTTEQQIANGDVTEAIARCSETSPKTVLVCQLCRNDLGAGKTGAQALAIAKQVFDACDAAGVPWIAAEDFPRLPTETNAASILAQRQSYNSLLAAYAASKRRKCLAWGSIYDRGDGYADPDHLDEVSPGHPRDTFGYRMGRTLYNALSDPAFFTLPATRPSIASLMAGANNICRNPYLTGSGGGATSPEAEPDNWRRGTGGGATIAHNHVSYGDGSGRYWMKITSSSSASAGYVWVYCDAISSGFADGDQLDALVEIKMPNATGWNGSGVALELSRSNSPYNPVNADGNPSIEGSAVFGIDRPTETLIFRTPRITAAAGATYQLKIYCYGSGEFWIGSPCVLVNNNTLPVI